MQATRRVSLANRIKFLFNFLSSLAVFSASSTGGVLMSEGRRRKRIKLMAAFNLILLLCDFYVWLGIGTMSASYFISRFSLLPLESR